MSLWNNFGRSPFQTHVFSALVSFFILSDNFFDSTYLLDHLDVQILNFMLNLLRKIVKKIEYSKSLLDSENYWCGHQQSYNFFLIISGHFRITQESQNQLIRNEEIAVTGEKTFSIFWKGKIFVADRKKYLYR